MTVEQVRVALADACAAISGWRASPYIRDTVTPPEIQISRGPTVFDSSMGRESDDFRYVVRAYVQRSSERAGQIMLDELCESAGPNSLKEVLEADAGVRAVVDFIRVREASEVRQSEIGSIVYLFVEFDVEVG